MFRRSVWVLLCLVTFLAPFGSAVAVSAEDATPGLFVREVKIKGDDFMVLQAVGTVQLGEYYLAYSSDPTEELVPEYQLGSGVLHDQQAVVLVGDEAIPTCDAVLTMDMPMELAETKGRVVLWHEQRTNDGKTLTYVESDSFTWANTKTGAYDILRPTTTEEGMLLPTWFRSLHNGAAVWQAGNLAVNEIGACTLSTKTGAVLHATTAPSAEPPATILETPEDSVDAVDPAESTENNNLLPVNITELLPNPAGTGTDATDEFIELYNPNEVNYDLSGYTLQTGLTTKHTYIVPDGVVLPPRTFMAFYSSVTGLSMSNTSGQAALLGPDGEIVAQSDPYGSAADGRAWALASGTWYWSLTPTANQANNITESAAATVLAAAKKAVKASTTAAKKATTKTAAKATAAAKKTPKETKKADTTQKVASAATQPVRGLHPGVLALVIAAAVGYGVYEYRHDVANRFHKFRADRAARRSHRQ